MSESNIANFPSPGERTAREGNRMRVVMIGSGNVATAFAMSLKQCCQVVQVCSRTLANARTLATKVGAQAITNLKNIDLTAHVYIIAVGDDAIAGVLNDAPATDGLWIHTSGSTPIDVFAGKRRRYGVLWPMQSLSKSNVTPMRDVHLFAEGIDDATTREVTTIAVAMSRNVHMVNSHDRLRMHLASVFACNFSNHMYTLAAELLHDAGIPFEAMLPLIKTTVEKLDSMTPAQSQTGPAARGDSSIIDRHMQMLDGDKRDIYNLLTRSIISHTKSGE